MTLEYERQTLRNGDLMLRNEFHSKYTKMPANYRAELLGGLVFEPSPVSWMHGEYHSQLNLLLRTYVIYTPDVAVADNASVFLSDEDEVQPDLVLRVTDEVRGKSRMTAKGFIEGAPELVAEIAYSSRALDLHLKKSRYKLAGVTEYIVVCLEPKQFYWFDLQNDVELTARRGIIKSKTFSKLWINCKALLELDDKRALNRLTMGLNSHGN